MTSIPRVSVIVPIYNAEETIEECVRSILALSFPSDELELLLVDNASTDRTPEVLAKYRGDVRLLYETTRGPAAARNQGLVNAKGAIVAFTDADCVVHTDWLKEIIAPLQEEDIGIVGGTILARQPCNAIEKFGELIHDHRKAIEVFQPPYVITMNWASRRAVLVEAGLFDARLLRQEDVDLTYRIMQAGYRLAFAPRAIVYHRNERTLLGLAKEGYAHGYHSIFLGHKHDRWVRGFVPGRRAERRPAPRELARRLARRLRVLRRRRWWPAERASLYWTIFNLGKKTGKAMGAVRARTEGRLIRRAEDA